MKKIILIVLGVMVTGAVLLISLALFLLNYKPPMPALPDQLKTTIHSPDKQYYVQSSARRPSMGSAGDMGEPFGCWVTVCYKTGPAPEDNMWCARSIMDIPDRLWGKQNIKWAEDSKSYTMHDGHGNSREVKIPEQ